MHTEVLRPELLELINELMDWKPIENFALVGGTSLALRSGYRESVDIDLFCHPGFNIDSLRNSLLYNYPEFMLTSVSNVGLFGSYRGIKVDLVHHPQHWLEPFENNDGIRLVSLADLAAMKVNAVIDRGSKKDFSDLLYLHQQGIPLTQSIDFFIQKYSKDLMFAAIRSLNFFNDTDEEFDPLYRNGWTWDYVRSEMTALGAQLTSHHPGQSQLKGPSGG